MFTPHVFLYSDGSCLGNPGPGGYVVILQCNGHSDKVCLESAERLSADHTKEITGSADYTTNNRMELQAVIAGLQALKRRCQVTLVTDSQYVVTILSGGKAKANLDLVQQVRQLSRQHDITVQQVRGHSSHTSAEPVPSLSRYSAQAMNERCDQLAKAASRQRKQTMARSREVVSCGA